MWEIQTDKQLPGRYLPLLFTSNILGGKQVGTAPTPPPAALRLPAPDSIPRSQDRRRPLVAVPRLLSLFPLELQEPTLGKTSSLGIAPWGPHHRGSAWVLCSLLSVTLRTFTSSVTNSEPFMGARHLMDPPTTMLLGDDRISQGRNNVWCRLDPSPKSPMQKFHLLICLRQIT